MKKESKKHDGIYMHVNKAHLLSDAVFSDTELRFIRKIVKVDDFPKGYYYSRGMIKAKMYGSRYTPYIMLSALEIAQRKIDQMQENLDDLIKAKKRIQSNKVYFLGNG